MNRDAVDIIIPTMDNVQQLIACCSSILQSRRQWPMRLILVNNGKIDLKPTFKNVEEYVTILNPGKNLGWTGGLAYGLKHSKAKYVMFANDDIFIPIASHMWLAQLARQIIVWPKIAAIGPASNVVMGKQNIWAQPPILAASPTFLIGFCILVRRSTLDEVGGIDESFDTGDDIDLSIRFLKAGYIMMIDNTVFVYHHGFQTGLKLYGDSSKPGGWNSREMTTATNKHLIQKHGFIAWRNTMCKELADGWFKDKVDAFDASMHDGKDREGEVVMSSVDGCKPSDVLEIGCGGRKTVEGCVGLDKEKKGARIPFTGMDCVADIVHDAQTPLPFKDGRFKVIIARHILEHCVDVIKALKGWKATLADDGILIISVPDENISRTIFLNSEHVHAFTPDSLTDIVESVGMRVTKRSERYGADSFTLEVRK